MADEHPASQRFREGLREGVPFAIAGGMLAISFGVVAQQAGFTDPGSGAVSTSGSASVGSPSEYALID